MKKFIVSFIIMFFGIIYIPFHVFAVAPNVVPSLREWTDGNNTTFNINAGSRICVDPTYSTQLMETANTFKDDLQQLTGGSYNVVNTSSPAAGDFWLTLNCTDSVIGNEGYLMTIDSHVTLKANSAKGVFYGTRSILQILNQSSDKTYMLKGSARDYSKYKERTFMLDVARKYFSVNYIKDYIKFMAYHKVNTLHIHFTDNQAFRLVSDTYPGLADSQSYTKAELRSIQDLAKKYNVTVIPEIDLPAHATAITNYLPSLRDTTFHDMLNLASPATTTFVHNILDEFIPVFDAPEFHIGTDEVPPNLDSNATLHNYAVSLGYTNANDVYRKFINDTNTYIKSKGKKTRIWAWFVKMPGTVTVNNDIAYDAWIADDINSVSTSGFKIINASDDWLYSVPGTDWQPNLAFLYQTWQPHQFQSRDFGGVAAQLSPTDPNITGIQFSNWNDISQNLGITEAQIDQIEEQPIRVISELGWGGPKSSSYAVFANRTSLVGSAPGLALIGTATTDDLVNLAYNRPVTASTSYNATLNAAYAVDKNMLTRWSSVEGVDPQWIYVDLGKPTNINSVKINWEAAYARSFKVQVSDDAASWTDVYSTTTGTGGTNDISFPTTTKRYVRIYGTQRGTNWGYSILDFGVYFNYRASAGFSSTQGANQWYYQQWNGSTYSNMTWNSGNWKGTDAACLVGNNWQHPDIQDSVRKWVAPTAGTIRITAAGNISLVPNGDGVNVKILKNTANIWPASGWQTIAANSSLSFPQKDVVVAAGDAIYFIVNKNGTNAYDTTTWDPIITYIPAQAVQTSVGQASVGFSSTQGTNQWYYQQWNGSIYSNMTWNTSSWKGTDAACLVGNNWQHPDIQDSVRKWVAPTAGTIRISAALGGNILVGPNGDGVKVKVLKNNSNIWPTSGWQTIGASTSYSFPQTDLTVVAGDVIYFIVNKNGTNAYDTTNWDPIVTYR